MSELTDLLMSILSTAGKEGEAGAFGVFDNIPGAEAGLTRAGALIGMLGGGNYSDELRNMQLRYEAAKSNAEENSSGIGSRIGAAIPYALTGPLAGTLLAAGNGLEDAGLEGMVAQGGTMGLINALTRGAGGQALGKIAPKLAEKLPSVATTNKIAIPALLAGSYVSEADNKGAQEAGKSMITDALMGIVPALVKGGGVAPNSDKAANLRAKVFGFTKKEIPRGSNLEKALRDPNSDLAEVAKMMRGGDARKLDTLSSKADEYNSTANSIRKAADAMLQKGAAEATPYMDATTMPSGASPKPGAEDVAGLLTGKMRPQGQQELPDPTTIDALFTVLSDEGTKKGPNIFKALNPGIDALENYAPGKKAGDVPVPNFRATDNENYIGKLRGEEAPAIAKKWGDKGTPGDTDFTRLRDAIKAYSYKQPNSNVLSKGEVDKGDFDNFIRQLLAQEESSKIGDFLGADELGKYKGANKALSSILPALGRMENNQGLPIRDEAYTALREMKLGTGGGMTPFVNKTINSMGVLPSSALGAILNTVISSPNTVRSGRLALGASPMAQGLSNSFSNLIAGRAAGELSQDMTPNQTYTEDMLNNMSDEEVMRIWSSMQSQQ